MKKDKNGKDIYNIGIMIGNVYTNHPQELIRGIRAAARKYPVNLEFFLGTQSSGFYKDLTGASDSADFEYQFNTIYDFALYGDLDALIISYGTLCIFLEEREQQAFFRKYSAIPRVILEEQEQSDNASSLISDNYHGVCRVMEHLITVHGYKKILHISGPKDNTDANERRQAYLDTMEKYHLPVTENMILYGDYSEYMTDEVEAFLKANPGAEAVCAANDGMAISTYKACQRMGIRVGKDLAVTGYDNISMAPSLDPPLTTVEQNGYDMGYMALEEAVALCQGNKGKENRLPAGLVARSSCGCSLAEGDGKLQELSEETLLQKLPEIAAWMTGELLLSTLDEGVGQYAQAHLQRLLSYIVETFYFSEEKVSVPEQFDRLQEMLQGIQEYEWERGMSPANAMGRLNEFMMALSALTKDAEKRQRLMELMRFLNEYVLNNYRYQQSVREIDYSRKAWLGPLQVREMIECGCNEKAVYLEAVRGLRRQDMRSSYILLFREPIVYRRDEEWKCPDSLYLAAFHEGETVRAYEPWERPMLTRKKGFSSLFHGKGHMYVAFFLFFQQTQYGILLCEIGSEDISATYVASLQLATGIHFLKLNQKEQEMKRQLQEMMNELEAKNQILQTVSHSDALTGLLNRRGFVEELLQQMKKRDGENAYLVFADLDHLKQINDTFGHVEGDYAICQIGDILKQQAGSSALTARIGGDEFISVLFPEEKLDEEQYICSIRRECRRRNDSADKPFLVECSLGMLEFVCEPGLEVARLLNRADAIMYQAKKERRESVLKRVWQATSSLHTQPEDGRERNEN